jgi:nitrogen fixation protein FixH
MFISQDNKQAFRNPWVLGWLGLLITVVLINVIFIVTAFYTTPGLVDKNYYEKGRDVEKNFLKKRQAKNRLGWELSMTLPDEVIVGQATSFSINVTDAAGMPLRDANARLQAYRPSDADADHNVAMEKVADGVFQSRLTLPLKGIWDIRIVVQQGEEELEISRRISALVP